MKKGFTLVELLVVIAVIGILSAIITPNLLNARNSARIAAGQRFDSSVYHSLGDHLEGEWMFDVPGSSLIDTSGMGNNGSTSSEPIYYSTGGYNGKGAFYFDGSDDYIDLGSATNITSATQLTITAWVKLSSSAPTYSNIVSTRSGGGTNTGIVFFVNNSDKKLGYWNGSSPAQYSETSLVVDKWFFVTIELNSTTCRFFINGVSNGTGTRGITAATGNLKIGWSGYSQSTEWFKGYIDDVRIYSSILSSSEIEKLYTEGTIKRDLVSF